MKDYTAPYYKPNLAGVLFGVTDSFLPGVAIGVLQEKIKDAKKISA